MHDLFTVPNFKKVEELQIFSTKLDLLNILDILGLMEQGYQNLKTYFTPLDMIGFFYTKSQEDWRTFNI